MSLKSGWCTAGQHVGSESENVCPLTFSSGAVCPCECHAQPQPEKRATLGHETSTRTK